MIAVDALENAVKQLRGGMAVAEAASFDDLYRDGVIQRFEYTMDLSWKLLRRVLFQSFDVQESDLRSKKDIFREAARVSLITDAERWIGHYEARNQTSHDYNQDKADRVFQQAKLFLEDVQDLLGVLRHVP
ncbi:MAG: HI0074 family nucleotidyltransferase substrate-binding subunit [Alphaproteobacteria bacterium]